MICRFFALISTYPLVMSIVSTSCSMYPQDNALEERFESYIRDKTGIEIDFTGNSPE
jgi:hypothetical protein